MNTGSHLELILGCMWAGKTTRLLTLYKQYKLSGFNPVIINYIDIQDESNQITTHDNQTTECLWCKNLSEIDNELLEYNCYLINEGQFYNDLDTWVIDKLDNENKTIYIAALDGDFQRKPFQNIINLIPHSDKIDKLKAICTNCKNGSYAIFTKRITKDTNIILLEQSAYKPVCRLCY